MNGISTHVLDTTTGRPGIGIRVRLDRRDLDGWSTLATSFTDAHGRVAGLLGDEALKRGDYRLVFDTAEYFGKETFYPEVEIAFRVAAPGEHHHIPLLLGPYGYTTYRGS